MAQRKQSWWKVGLIPWLLGARPRPRLHWKGDGIYDVELDSSYGPKFKDDVDCQLNLFYIVGAYQRTGRAFYCRASLGYLSQHRDLRGKVLVSIKSHHYSGPVGILRPPAHQAYVSAVTQFKVRHNVSCDAVVTWPNEVVSGTDSDFTVRLSFADPMRLINEDEEQLPPPLPA